MSAVAAAATKAQSLLAFIGLLTVLGWDLTTFIRIVIGLGLALAVALESSGAGHRIWPRRIKPPTHYSKAA
ncbi:hypothetical protein ACFWJT_15810 [Streptomyces sp. NPDC127069]|uniref:hypothetical protein n=1 Tax=Streptomyces sp. NPDC127069 TaxID=3347128 RepID=UPI0036608559